MKHRFDNIFWGILLILAGVLVFAQQRGWVGMFTPQFWALAFAGLALIFLVRYLFAGWRSWGYLFPTCIFLALAAIVWLGFLNIQQPWMASPLFAAIAVPFLVAFAVDFRKNWWALIPAFIMLVLCGVVFFSDRLQGEIVGAAFTFAIALPFLAVYLGDRKKQWALIPAFTLGAIGLLSLLGLFIGDWSGALVPLLISLPFFYVYFRNPQRWWALIPAGVMASIGISAILSMPFLGRFAHSSLPAAIMFVGWAATFFWLWRQREQVPTYWARIPALVLGIVAAVLLVTGAFTELGMAAALLVGGAVLIYFSLRRRPGTPPSDNNS
jgi:hypothetical protein